MIARAHHWLKSIGCVELRCKLRNQACVGDPGLYIWSYKAGRRLLGHIEVSEDSRVQEDLGPQRGLKRICNLAFCDPESRVPSIRDSRPW